jgi:Uma2 family endonuclease
MSSSTEAFDCGEKWLRYQTWLPNLAHYVLVSQTKPEVEHFERQRDGRWLYSRLAGVESLLRLASIDFSLALSEIYDRVTFAIEEN